MAETEERANSESSLKYGCPFYCILKWNILSVSSAKNVLTSPCFEFSPKLKWNLLLDPAARDNHGSRSVGIYLKNQNYSNLKGSRLKGEITVYGSNNNEIFKKVFEEKISSVFLNEIKFYVDRNAFLENDSSQYGDCCLIHCDIIISPPIADERLIHLITLASDFQKIYDYSKNSDVTIYGSDGSIRAHKFILCARSNVLEKMLDNFSNWVHCESELSLIHTVLPFMYSGDPQYLIIKYPFRTIGEIIAVAKKLNLKELEKIFTPMGILWNTQFQVKKFSYELKIYNFSKLEVSLNDRIESFSNDENDTKWKIFIRRPYDRSNNIFQYGVYLAKLSPSNTAQDVEIDFCMRNPSTGEGITKNLSHIFSRNEEQILITSVDSQTLYERILNCDTLNIICRLKIHGKSVSWVDCYNIYLDCIDDSRLLKGLCRDMIHLYETKKHTDIVLFVGHEQLAAHKAVLWARSPYFLDKVPFSATQYSVTPTDAVTMKDILPYMYAAKLPQLNQDNSTKLYEASILFELHDLRKFCTEYIQVNISVENILDILIMAHKHCDECLVRAAETFASATRISGVLLCTSRWKLFCQAYNELALRLYDKMVRYSHNMRQ